MKTVVGVVFAFASAGCFAAGYVGQHRAVGEIDPLSIRHPLRGAKHLLTNRRWLVGYLANWTGLGLYVAAVAFAPLSTVQAISAGAIGTLALLGRRIGSIDRRERAFAAVATVGLACVLVTVHAAPAGSHFAAGAVGLFVGIEVAVGAAVVVCVPSRSRGPALGVCSGFAYGAGDVAIKAALGGKVVFIPIIVVCFLIGLITLQLSYQQASLLASGGVSSLLSNATPIIAGVAFFSESGGSAAEGWIRAIGFVAVVVAAVGLAADPTGRDGLGAGVVDARADGADRDPDGEHAT